MRLFIGFELPNQVKDYLYDLQSNLLLHAIKGNKTLYQNFHLTLIFLGEVKAYKLDLLSDIINEAIKDFKAFNITIKDIGSFKARETYILWSKITEGEGFLRKIYEALESLLYQDGWLDEKKNYKPHITLARQVEMNLNQTNQMIKAYPHNIEIGEITLFQSHRISDVLTYTPIMRFPLKK